MCAASSPAEPPTGPSGPRPPPAPGAPPGPAPGPASPARPRRRPSPPAPQGDERPRFLRRRRAEAVSALLPVAAFLALMPPFVRIFAHDGRIFGAPSALVFLLALWLGLVIGTRILARRLMRRDPGP